MKITKEQYDALNKINACSYNETGSTCIDVNALTKDDKIYILPNCKIKKLDLRKWLKHKGFKQVHKPELATVIVTTSDIISYNRLNLKIEAIIPAGKYRYFNSSTVHADYLKDNKLSEWRLINFINSVHFPNGGRVSYEGEIFKSALNNYESSYSLMIYLKCLNKPEIVNALASDVKLINVDDLQQVLYNWEIKNNSRESINYDWDNLKSLILSDSSELVFVMIKKMNFENILSELLSCYYSHKVDVEFKKKLKREIFVRNPKLNNLLPAPYNHFLSTSWNKDFRVDGLISVCKKNGIILDKNKFDWIIDQYD